MKHSIWIYSSLEGTERSVLTDWKPGPSIDWSADSRSLIFFKNIEPGKHEIWHVPIDGSALKKIDLRADGTVRSAAAHPDGKKIAFTVLKP